MTLRTLCRGFYKYCGCGCGKSMKVFNKDGQSTKFLRGHSQKINPLKGEYNPNWRGGKRIDKDGYVLIYTPSHPFTDKTKCVREHRLIYEQYYNCCLFPWIEVHHINGIKNDNRIENLQPITSSDHHRYHMTDGGLSRLGKHKDMSKTICFKCRSKDTAVRNPNGELKTAMFRWHHLPNDKINWYCNNCYVKDMRLRKKSILNNVQD